MVLARCKLYLPTVPALTEPPQHSSFPGCCGVSLLQTPESGTQKLQGCFQAPFISLTVPLFIPPNWHIWLLVISSVQLKNHHSRRVVFRETMVFPLLVIQQHQLGLFQMMLKWMNSQERQPIKCNQSAMA